MKKLGLWSEEQELEEKLEKIKDYLTEGKTYVQRDLEDQIAEEYKLRGKRYKKTQIKENMSKVTPTKIVVQDVLELLKKGYTRYEKDNQGYGSIQKHYGLNASQVAKLFRSTDKLKQKKTIKPAFEIVDLENKPTEQETLERGTFAPVETEVKESKKENLFS